MSKVLAVLPSLVNEVVHVFTSFLGFRGSAGPIVDVSVLFIYTRIYESIARTSRLEAPQGDHMDARTCAGTSDGRGDSVATPCAYASSATAVATRALTSRIVDSGG